MDKTSELFLGLLDKSSLYTSTRTFAHSESHKKWANHEDGPILIFLFKKLTVLTEANFVSHKNMLQGVVTHCDSHVPLPHAPVNMKTLFLLFRLPIFEDGEWWIYFV